MRELAITTSVETFINKEDERNREVGFWVLSSKAQSLSHLHDMYASVTFTTTHGEREIS